MRQEQAASKPAMRASHETSPSRARRAGRSAALRAPRFRLCLPVWYRAEDETRWHTGVTKRVSSSGTLIRADGLAVSSKPIVVAIALPSAPGWLVGRGHIVRVVQAAAQGDPLVFAVSVSRYRIVHADCVLS